MSPMNQVALADRGSTTPLDSNCRKGLSRVGSFLLVALNGVLWMLVLGVQVGLGPKFEQIFTDFGVALSGLTQAAIVGSRWLRGTNPGQLFPLWPLAGVGISLILAGCHVASRRNRFATVVLALLAVVGFLTFTLLVVAYHHPLQTMIQSLQGGA